VCDGCVGHAHGCEDEGREHAGAILAGHAVEDRRAVPVRDQPHGSRDFSAAHLREREVVVGAWTQVVKHRVVEGNMLDDAFLMFGDAPIGSDL
jgi:hypothetical protein